MKTVEHFREKIRNCYRKYTKICSKIYSFLGNKKLSSNQNVSRDHATMEQDAFLGDISILKSDKNICKGQNAFNFFSLQATAVDRCVVRMQSDF